MQSDPSPSTSNRSSLSYLLLAMGVLLLAAGAAYAGFLWGSAADAAVAEVPATPLPSSTPLVTEVEVTREVVVILTPTPMPSPTSTVAAVAPEEQPAAAETPVATRPAPSASDASDLTEFDTFDEVWQIITEEYDGELPDEDDRLYSAIVGSLESLDDEYTRFLRPEIAARMREDMGGSVSGIGAFVRETDDGQVEIVRPMDGQPADLAGLEPGDLIIGIDGESVLDLSFDEVLLMVRGPEGTMVTLTVAREGAEEPLDFEVTRTLFEVPVVESELLVEGDKRIAYVRLSSFTRAAEQSVLDALTPLLAEDPDGIILDLRDNGGGFLDQAVAVSDIFLPQGVVLLERSDNGLDETFNAFDGDIGETLPLAVLVNAGSASASEILAGAVQDNDRGTLIGETTFGKGSVQHVHTLADGSELRVTIARWYTPANRSISDLGIAPDIEVPTPEDLGGEDDPQLRAAIEHLLGSE